MKRALMVGWLGVVCLFGIGLHVYADGENPPRLLVQVSESLDGEASEHNYAMYIVSQQLKGLGFEVVNGSGCAWFDPEPAEGEFDFVLRGDAKIELDRLSIYYGETVAVIFNRTREGNLYAGADTNVAISSFVRADTAGVAQEGRPYDKMFAAGQLEAQKRCGNYMFIEFMRLDEMQALIPDEKKARIRRLIENYERDVLKVGD